MPDSDGSLSHSWTDLRGTKSTFWFVHNAATLFFTCNGLMCLPYRRIRRVMKSCKSHQIIHLQIWPTSRFSCVSAASSLICDTHLMCIPNEMIITAPNSSYCLSSMAALHKSQSLKVTIMKTHAERVLDTFVARSWLYKSESVFGLPRLFQS